MANMITPAPSAQQEALLERVRLKPSGAIIVEAVAGSGKTTTLRQVCNLLASMGRKPEEVMYMAFSQKMAREMTSKLAGLASVKTTYSIGLSAITKGLGKRVAVNQKKALALRDHLDSFPHVRAMADGERMEYKADMIRLLEFALMGLVQPTLEGTEALLDHYGLDYSPAQTQPVLEALLEATKRLAITGKREITFADMIGLPGVMGWYPKTYPVILVDEAQDLSPAQLHIALGSLAPGGLAIFVGDRAQAIFGFAGAGCDSIDRIIEATGAETFPLSVTFRCPTSHVDLARRMVPEITPAPGAGTGIVEILNRERAAEEIRRGDLVICRRTAPVVSMAFTLIGKGIKAKVVGRKIGEGLVALARKVAGKVPMVQFPDQIDQYDAKMSGVLANKPSRLQTLRDQLRCLSVIYTSNVPDTLPGLVAAIEAIFEESEDEITGEVVLSTIHRAKGLEADRVFLLDADRVRIPSPLEWQAQQEANLHYVALTRSKEALYLVP
ncbi:MAG: ATP-dependent helicase [Cyanobacteria bacterium K_DeepCast_35m_m2_023]|nr:ATP-dependent helicase [Cyanobacteria bacterium K_DeepCast_35m_m2_023]